MKSESGHFFKNQLTIWYVFFREISSHFHLLIGLFGFFAENQLAVNA
jgi:hypothetical protein